MATFTADDVHFVRVGGVVNASHVLYTFTTRTPPAGTWDDSPPTVAVNALHSAIETKPASMKFLGTLATAPGITVSLAQRTETAAFLKAATRSALTVKTAATGAAVRVTRFISKSANTINVTDSAPFSVDSYYWIGAQAFQVTAIPGGGLTLTVARQKLGTLSVAVPMPGVGATIQTAPATVKGLPVTAGVITSAGAEEVRFRGFVDSVALASGLMISIGVRSIIQHIRDAPYTVPTAINTPLPIDPSGDDRDIGSVVVRGWVPLEVDTETHGPRVADSGEPWTRARWIATGGEWLVTTVVHVPSLSGFDAAGRWIDRYRVDTDAEWHGARGNVVPVHAYGKDATVYNFTETDARFEHWHAVFNDLDRVEWALTYADPPIWSALVLDLLTRDEPHGSGMAINSDYLAPDAAAVANAQLPVAGVDLPGTMENAGLPARDAWVLPAMKSKKWAEMLRDGFLRPIWRGFGVDSSARLRALNWLDSSLGAEIKTITGSHALGKAEYKITDSTTSATAIYLINFMVEDRIIVTERSTLGRTSSVEFVGKHSVRVFAPDVQAADFGTADELDVPGTLAGDEDWRTAIVGFASNAVLRFGARVRELTIQLQPSVTLTPGDHITITLPHLPDVDGSVSASSPPIMRGFALGVGIDKGRIQGTRLAITGYTTDPTPTRGTWAPCATVTGWTGGTSYAAISANAWTSASHPLGITADYKAWDLLDWAGGETAAVIICNADFSTRGTATLELVHSSLGLKLTSRSIAPAAGNLIIPAAFDDQTAAWKAATYTANVGGPVVHLAGTNSLVGAAGSSAWGWS